MVKVNTIYVETKSRTDFIDITGKVNDIVRSAGKKDGLCVVYVPHTTAALFINEGADPDVARDIAVLIDKLIPWYHADYKHAEGNSAAHIKSAIIGNSRVIPIAEGKLTLGTWESIFFAEFDGPRRRKVIVTIM